MIDFKQYISEASVKGKNTHMTHIEDRVLYGGVKGAREAIFALRGMRDMLAGQSSKTTDVTVKWDGAPAVFAGIDPTDGRFFVAKKGIFNKNPKVYKTNKDIDNDTSGDLNKKLNMMLKKKNKRILLAKKGRMKYHKKFNSVLVADYIVSKTFNINKKFNW